MRRATALRKISLPTWTADAVTLLGLALYLIQSIGFAYSTVSNLDEGAYLLKGYLFATGAYTPFEAGISTGKAPLAFLIPGYAQLLFGAGLRTGRYLAAFFGIMAVFGTWVAARRIGGKWLAAAAVWVFTVSPVIIKYYSNGATQSTIACLLAWMLVFSLGQGRSFWQLTLAGFLAALMMFVRQNMMPVLPLLILYTFWQHGRKAWGLAVAGIFTTASFFYIYWPDILQLWYWVPYLSQFIPPQLRYTGGGVLSRWTLEANNSARLLSVAQALRYHFIPLTGVLLSLPFLPKFKTWKTHPSFKDALFLFLLFTGLLYMHYEAAIVRDYCIFCLSPYIAFFNVAGILLTVLLVKLWRMEERGIFSALAISFILLLSAALIGFSAFEKIGGPLLNLPAPRIRGLHLLPGWVTWWQLLSNKFNLDYNLAQRYISALFGLSLGILIFVIGYIIWKRTWRSAAGFGISLAGLVLSLGILLSPVMHGRVSDCDTDVIAANEQIGKYLAGIIPPGSLVYWHGGLSAAPLLYLKDVRIFPAQINAGYTYRSGADTQQAIRFGYWNEELDEQWKATADFFIIEDQYYYEQWKDFFTPSQFDEFPRSPVGSSCMPKSTLRIFRRNQ